MSKTVDTQSPQEDNRDVVRIEGLRKTFANGSIVACSDINLEIAPDEFVVLLGPSGCGKTTTLRCIAGLEEPDQGGIFVGDEEITYAQPKDRDLAFVFQSIALFPHMTVRENMRFGLDMKGDWDIDERNERVEEAAEMLGIGQLLDRKPSALSGGQQQRVSVGRAMVTEPVAFLFDEPFSALDANLRDQMRTEIKQLQRELKTSMVFVTHDQEEAMTLGDKIVVMNEGKTQQIASPHEIYNEPENRFVAEFIGSPSTNFFPATVEVDNNDVELATELFSLSLTNQRAEQIADLDGDQVSIGVRPENLEVSQEGYFDAEIEVVEPQGSRDVIRLNAGGRGLRATAPGGEVNEESTVSIQFDREDFWIFNSNGDRLI